MFFSKQNNQSRWKMGPSDESIVAGIRAGERHLFEVLMRRHNQRLFRAIRALLKSECEVEDVMQQTYVDALANLSQLRAATSVSSWLVQIAVNEALVRLRQQRRLISSDTGFDRMEKVQSGLE